MDALFVALMNRDPGADALNALSKIDAVAPVFVDSIFGLPLEYARFDIRVGADDRIVVFDLRSGRVVSLCNLAETYIIGFKASNPGARSAGPLIGDLSRAALGLPPAGGESKLIDAMLNPDPEFLDRASQIIQRAYKNSVISGPAETALMDFARRRAANLAGPLGVAEAISRYASVSSEGCDSRLQAAFSAIALCDLVTLAKALSSERPITREKDVERLRVHAPILGAERDAPSRGPVPEAIPSLGDRLVKLFAMARGRRPPHYLPGVVRLALIRETIISTWGSDSDFTAHLLATLEVVIKCEEEIDRAVEIDRAAQ